jgi:heme oxygenase
MGIQTHREVETTSLPLDLADHGPSEMTLSALLRDRTRRAHAAVEVSFSLEARLASFAAYGALLIALRELYSGMELRLRAVAGWDRLSPAVDIESRCRTALLDDDLLRMGLFVQSAGAQASLPLPQLDSMGEALGCLYVLEGSVLGGRIVSHRACLALGNQLPVTFFSSENRKNGMEDWRSFQASLDNFGYGHEQVVANVVVAGALETFAAMGVWLEKISNE